MRFKILLPLSTLLFVVIFLVGMQHPSIAFAFTTNDISVDIAPENPVPHQNTTITLSSYAANLDSVLITWSVNGKTATSGIGKKSFSVDSGNTGVATKIGVKISLPDGEINKTITIRPSVMVLLWQATDSYVPPFYKGKALLSEGSEVKVVAMPEIKSGSGLVGVKNMTYSWQKDFTNDQASSGYGKNALTYVTDYLDGASTISVVATTIDQKYSSSASIKTNTTAPQIDFYKRDPSLGTLWNQALHDGHRISGNEIIVAIPYYVSPKEIRLPSLVFRWYINDEMIDAKNYFKNIMPLKVDANTSGISTLRLDIENTDKILETVSKGITIQF